MDPTVDDELISILKNTAVSAEARSQGWEYILRLSVSGDGVRHLIRSEKYIPFILAYLCQAGEEEFVPMALKSLINIAADDQGVFEILRSRKDICSYLLNSVHEKNKSTCYKCYLLANMSAKHKAVKVIMDILLSSKGLLQKLVEVYCSNDISERTQYDFLTLVFANVSRLTEGRRFLLQDADFMKNIIKFIKASEPESRRVGTALVLRNCCLETDYHDKLLNDVGILPALLLPLMVPQEYDAEYEEMGTLSPELQNKCLQEVKRMDESVSVRRVLVEALTILCYSENGWRHLKSNGTYYVVRHLHTVETDSATKEAIEHLVTYFLVKDYTKPEEIDTSASDELTKQLEADFTKGLPDFVVM